MGKFDNLVYERRFGAPHMREADDRETGRTQRKQTFGGLRSLVDLGPNKITRAVLRPFRARSIYYATAFLEIKFLDRNPGAGS
jgi:hypothetical protein